MELNEIDPMDYISVIRNTTLLGGYRFSQYKGEPCVLHGNSIVIITGLLPTETVKEEISKEIE